MLNVYDDEKFNAISYAYRSWPASDPAGVTERFEELCDYVGGLLRAAYDDGAIDFRQSNE